MDSLTNVSLTIYFHSLWLGKFSQDTFIYFLIFLQDRFKSRETISVFGALCVTVTWSYLYVQDGGHNLKNVQHRMLLQSGCSTLLTSLWGDLGLSKLSVSERSTTDVNKSGRLAVGLVIMVSVDVQGKRKPRGEIDGCKIFIWQTLKLKPVSEWKDWHYGLQKSLAVLLILQWFLWVLTLLALMLPLMPG